jgi:hypothetical protein
MREYCGLAPITWGENITAASTIVKATHWTELQNAIAAVNPQTYTAVKKGDFI